MASAVQQSRETMIDRIDRRILSILQEDCTIPVAEIGRRVGFRPRRAGGGSRNSRKTA
jgi:DNA-binding Lrp family transcriptional regulator